MSVLTEGWERNLRNGGDNRFESFAAGPISPSGLDAGGTGSSTAEIFSVKPDSGGSGGRAAHASSSEIDRGTRMVVGIRRCGAEVEDEGSEGVGMIFSERWKWEVDSSHVFTAFAF